MAEARYDAIVVGAGFSGLYALHRLRGLGLSVRVLEAGGGVGGTWYWNRYPGARCDIESVDYSYSFSEELAAGVDVERALSGPAGDPALPRARRRPLRPAPRHPARHARSIGARYDEAASRWTIAHRGRRALSARLLRHGDRDALGRSSAPTSRASTTSRASGSTPRAGRRRASTLAGRRVGIIGTGSTGIQAAPAIAEQAEHLYVFQRTPNFSLPASNRPLDRRRGARRSRPPTPSAGARRASRSSACPSTRADAARRSTATRRGARRRPSRRAGSSGGLGAS